MLDWTSHYYRNEALGLIKARNERSKKHSNNLTEFPKDQQEPQYAPAQRNSTMFVGSSTLIIPLWRVHLAGYGTRHWLPSRALPIAFGCSHSYYHKAPLCRLCTRYCLANSDDAFSSRSWRWRALLLSLVKPSRIRADAAFAHICPLGTCVCVGQRLALEATGTRFEKHHVFWHIGSFGISNGQKRHRTKRTASAPGPGLRTMRCFRTTCLLWRR